MRYHISRSPSGMDLAGLGQTKTLSQMLEDVLVSLPRAVATAERLTPTIERLTPVAENVNAWIPYITVGIWGLAAAVAYSAMVRKG